ncbi:5-hydroxytryptamine receptor 1B-like [Strongylocentrotus purpuratus]|uniref:G-protein coupled receptors family 1 profile domain-containing protein n=1 Tax=Strongylocentrotus purpuratus TaxID=7668 RepID=A0A7M7HM36_STRPU|nr:5-hydroxytryptamine receptor 1B-like [Strongylocentrotus purpuratus]
METSAPVVMETLSSDPLGKSDDDEDGRSTDDVATSGTKVTVKRKKQIHLKHRRVTKMTALMISASCICWTPSLLYHADLTWVTDAHWFGVFAMWLAYCHTLADTLIYAIMNRRVRAEMARMARNAKSQVVGMCRR